MSANVQQTEAAQLCFNGIMQGSGDWFHGNLFGSFLYETPVGNLLQISQKFVCLMLIYTQDKNDSFLSVCVYFLDEPPT